MSKVYTVHYVSSEIQEHVLGYFSSFAKADAFAHSQAVSNGLTRLNERLWFSDSWATVYIKEHPLDTSD